MSVLKRLSSFSVVFGITTIATLSTHACPQVQGNRPQWHNAVSAMPPEPNNEGERNLRFQRNAQFDDQSGSKRRLDISPEDPDPTVFHGVSVYYTRQAPLPSSLSNVVVLGSVAGFQAYFSNDKTAIYTELQIHIEKLFKNQLREIGTTIVVDEGGGAIRLPDSKVAEQVIFPLETDVDIGKRYVFFLTFDEKTEIFRIVKAWELKNGQAQPLAQTDLKDQKTGVSKYAGMSEVDFLNAVQQSVTLTSE